MLVNISYFRHIALLILLVSVIIFGQPEVARAETKTSPEKCSLGIYITSLHDLNLSDKSFGSVFWLWSNCPSKDAEPLKVDIVNAKSSDNTLDSTEKKGNVYWEQHKTNAVLRHNWNIKNFPFDRQKLEMEFEHNLSDINKLVYVPDTANSSYNHKINLPGFRITDFKIQENKFKYPTNFGDPESKGSSTYSRIIVTIKIVRNGLMDFLKLNTTTYIAFGLSFISFFLNPAPSDIFSTRISLLVGCLFAVVINMQSSEAMLGRTSGLTLVDAIHISTLMYILTAVAVTVAAHIYHQNGYQKFSILINGRVRNLLSISFVCVNILMIISAAFK